MSKTIVHRVRFIDFVPEAIVALAFNDIGSRLAVCRGGSDIEIWNVQNRWHQEMKISLAETTAVRSLKWTAPVQGQPARLFASGLGGSVFEIDFVKLCPKNIRSSFGGAVWSMALNFAQTILAIGCEDGCIRLFDIDGRQLEYKKSFPATSARILSLAWHCDDELIYSGGADSTIRRWNVKTGQNTSRMMVENYGGEPTLVWTLIVLRDLTVISGDSLGHVQIWEGTHGTLTCSFSQHSADVRALAVSACATQIFASGIDNQITMLQKTSEGKWVYTHSRRPHTHDVQAMAVTTVKKTGAEILVSGGVDTKLCCYDVSNFQTNAPLKVPPFPQRPTIQLAAAPRLLLVQHDYKLELWQIANGLAEDAIKNTEVGQRMTLDGQQSLALQMNLEGPNKLVCSALSADASWLACSDTKKLKLFSIVIDDGTYIVKRVALPSSCSSPAFRLVFSPSSNTLISASTNADVKILDLTNKVVAQTFAHHRRGVSSAEGQLNQNNNFDGPCAVCSLAISEDGQWLASGDLHNNIHIFNLDNGKYYCSLPALDSMHTVFAFHPSSSTLVVACTSNRFHIFDLEERKYSDWSVEFGHQLPAALLRRTERISGIVFDRARPNSIVLHSHNYFCVVDLDKPLHSGGGGEETASAKALAKKRKRTSQNGSENNLSSSKHSHQNFRFVHRYKPLNFMGFVGPGEMIVVETPWLKVMQHFPDMLYRPRYGT